MAQHVKRLVWLAEALLLAEFASKPAPKCLTSLQFDLPTLIKERARNSSCARTAFFLAVMHHNVGHLEEAFQAYGQRLTMGGSPEEVYESHLRRVSVSGASAGSPLFYIYGVADGALVLGCRQGVGVRNSTGKRARS